MRMPFKSKLPSPHQADQAALCIPQPDGHGRVTEHEKQESKWTEDDHIPQELVEVQEEEPEQTPEEDESPELVNLTGIVLIQMITLMSIFLI